jgi:hypothetical protein
MLGKVAVERLVDQEKTNKQLSQESKELKRSLLTQNVHLAPNTQQAEQAGFTRAKNHETCQSIFPEN